MEHHKLYLTVKRAQLDLDCIARFGFTKPTVLEPGPYHMLSCTAVPPAR